MLTTIEAPDSQAASLKKAGVGSLLGTAAGFFLGAVCYGADLPDILLTMMIGLMFGVVFGATFTVPSSFTLLEEDDDIDLSGASTGSFHSD